MNDKDKLKQMAAPNSERIAIAVEELLKVNKKILKRKDEQKTGDITARKRQEKHNKKGTRLNIIGLLVACSALYISLVGRDHAIVILIKELLLW